MPTALLIRATLAVYVVLAIPRFGQRAPISHGREFQLTHPCPWTGLTSGACPRLRHGSSRAARLWRA